MNIFYKDSKMYSFNKDSLCGFRGKIVSAAVIALLCLSSCGEVSSSEVSTPDSTASLSQSDESLPSDEEMLSAAQETVKQFFELADKGEYSKMSALCSESLTEYYGYDTLADGENIEHNRLTFHDDRAVVTDKNGNKLSVLRLTIERDSQPEPVECFMAVKYSDGEYRIDDICRYLDGRKAADFLRIKFDEYTNIYYTTLELVLRYVTSCYQAPDSADQEFGLTFDRELADGTYSSGDGSGFMTNVETMMRKFSELGYGSTQVEEYISQIDEFSCTVVVKDGKAESYSATFTDGDMSCEKHYPQ